MNSYFISDLHLDDRHPATTSLFYKLLDSARNNAESLYILGDFFEFWIGDDFSTSFSEDVIGKLAEAVTGGLKIYLMAGNRDFLYGETFFTSSKTHPLHEETVIDLYQCPTLLMHGDTLCTDDQKYLRYRSIVRNKYVQKLFLNLPLSLRIKISSKMRASSQRYVTQADVNILDVNQTAVQKIMCKHDVTELIHGHTHRPAIHEFDFLNKKYRRIVLGAWHTDGSVLITRDNGDRDLIIYK